mgnify:CR=1 FL=1
MKKLLEIGGVDFTPLVKGYKLDYNVLVKEEGRNARGDLSITILNRKAKLNIVFRPTNETELASLLDAIQPFVFSITYWDTRTEAQATGTFYSNTASPEFYSNSNDKGIFNDLSINFIEL